ncbi:MAG: ankyrin repeat domain-containing protein [Planctomycetaceae bacterium]|nr:ankyrin repeat domain-containing protein [Planctomycetaceae bacterium]
MMAEPRQFYFDDGKSRKRWQIATKGKSHTVKYGRLTGALRESKKTFESAAAARADAEKLTSKKLRDGYVEIDATRLQFVRPRGLRKATRSQVTQFEKQLGVKLPGEYRDFLVNTNGGRANPGYVRIPARDDIENVDAGSIFHLRPSKPGIEELNYEIERTSVLLPDGYLPIAGGSDLFTLSLKSKTYGAVHWWFHESEELDDDGNFLESAGHLLAGSFNEFLTRISRVFEAEEIVPETKKTAKSTAKKKSSKPSVRKLISTIKHTHTPAKVKEIKRLIKDVGDLSGIEDGKWPFINLNDASLLKCLLDAGLSPEIIDEDRHTLLYQCAACPECIDLLAKRGVDLDRRSGGDGETAFMRAMFLEGIPAVRRLAKHGANPVWRPPSHVEDRLKYNKKLAAAVKQIREKWKNSPASRKAKSTPKKKAVKKGPKPTLNQLLKLLKPHDWIQEGEHIQGLEEIIAGLGSLKKLKKGQWAELDKFEDPHLLGVLLTAGLNPNITTKSGNTLLRQCVSHPDCIKQLVKAGAKIDQPNEDGETPLMLASYQGEQDCVQALLDAGADPTREFSQFAQVLLNMDEEMTAFIESARQKWKQKQPKSKKVSPKKSSQGTIESNTLGELKFDRKLEECSTKMEHKDTSIALRLVCESSEWLEHLVTFAESVWKQRVRHFKAFREYSVENLLETLNGFLDCGEDAPPQLTQGQLRKILNSPFSITVYADGEGALSFELSGGEDNRLCDHSFSVFFDANAEPTDGEVNSLF